MASPRLFSSYLRERDGTQPQATSGQALADLRD
jgi:hypothetical protein